MVQGRQYEKDTLNKEAVRFGSRSIGDHGGLKTEHQISNLTGCSCELMFNVPVNIFQSCRFLGIKGVVWGVIAQ